MSARNSPELIAACYVLHRLSVPRHPPNALVMLDPYQKPYLFGVNVPSYPTRSRGDVRYAPLVDNLNLYETVFGTENIENDFLPTCLACGSPVWASADPNTTQTRRLSFYQSAMCLLSVNCA